MTCTITGTAGLPDGTVYANARFRFYRLPQSVVSQDGRAVVPKTITVQSNGSGAVSFDLLPGNYVGTEAATDTSFNFVVPEAASADWTDCLDAAAAPLVSSLPAEYVEMTGGGTAQDYAGFGTRAAFVAWASGKTPATGTVINAAGYAYRYTGSGTFIPDLAGWVPEGDIYPQHFGTIDGTADEVQINLASAYAATLSAIIGAGRVMFTGQYTIAAPVLIRSGVAYEGAGRASVKLANGANCNVAEVVNWASLIGTNDYSDSTPNSFALVKLTFDGNMANQSPANPDLCNGLATYGYRFALDRVTILNAKGHGWRTEWGDFGEATGGLEAMINEVKVDRCGRHGVWFKGPHDISMDSVKVIDAGQETDNTYDAFYVEQYSGIITDLHTWHRAATTNRVRYGFNGGFFHLINPHCEGGRRQFRLTGSCIVNGAKAYAPRSDNSQIVIDGERNTFTGVFNFSSANPRPAVLELGANTAAALNDITMIAQLGTTGSAPVVTNTNNIGNNRIHIRAVNADVANMVSGAFDNYDTVEISQEFGSAYYLSREPGVTRDAGLITAFPDFSDAIFEIANGSDPTKRVKFSAVNVPTATTLTYTLPGVSGGIINTNSNTTMNSAMATANVWYEFLPSPFAPASGVTLTLAQLQQLVINYTGAVANIQMPAATALDAASLWPVNTALEFSVVNTGSGTATITSNTGVTTLGSMAVAAGASGLFRCRKSATSTYIVVRIS